MPHYLSAWEWVSDKSGNCWQAPGGNAIGALDMRSLPQQSVAGGIPQGGGLFSYGSPQVGLLARMPDTPEDNLTLAQKDVIKQVFGLPRDWVVPDKFGAAIFAALITQADPTGETRFKPLRGYGGRQLRLALGGQVFGDVACRRGGLEELATLVVFKSDYRRNRTLVDQGKLPLEALQKYTGWLCQRLRVTPDEVLPPEYVSDGSKPPSTEVGDTFGRADNTNLNAADTGKTLDGAPGTWQWTEVQDDFSIVSETLQSNADPPCSARIEQDLSSDDQSITGSCRRNDTIARYACLAARFAAAANTFYCGGHSNVATNTYTIRKVVAGTATALQNANGTAPGTGFVATIFSVDGSTLTLTSGGTQRISLTDVAITGNLRCGVGTASNTGMESSWDTLVGADIAASSGFAHSQAFIFG